MKVVKYFLFVVAIISLSGCASQSLLDKYRNQSAKQIFVAGEKAMLDGDMAEASEHFEALQALYPFGPYARQSQLDSIYVYYAGGDYASTEAAAQRYIHLYPLGPHTDYAEYMQGLAESTQTVGFFEKHFALDRGSRDLTSYQKSFASFVQLIQHFPHSLYAADAHKRLVYLRNLFAKHYLNIANYYYSRKAYVAAAQQAAVIVKHYQRTPSVPDALVIMVKSYRKLQLPKQANDIISIITLNYPNKLAELKN